MKMNIKYRIAVLGSFLIFTSNIPASSNTNQTVKPHTNAVVFINMSKACSCIAVECNAMKADLFIIMNRPEYINLSFIKTDISTEPEIAYKLMEQYGLQFPPGLAVINGKGEVIYRAVPYYYQGEFINALEQLNYSASKYFDDKKTKEP